MDDIVRLICKNLEDHDKSIARILNNMKHTNAQVSKLSMIVGMQSLVILGLALRINNLDGEIKGLRESKGE